MNAPIDMMPTKGQRWRHYKGDIYVILGISYDEESGFPRVQYRNDRASEPMIHGRLLQSFLGYSPVTREKRFTFVGEG